MILDQKLYHVKHVSKYIFKLNTNSITYILLNDSNCIFSGEMMTLDAEPFTLVEREGFSNLMKHLVPRYSLLSRTYFSRTLMPEIYKEIRTQMEAKLSTAKYISFTTDIWTSSVNNESFISLTAHL